MLKNKKAKNEINEIYTGPLKRDSFPFNDTHLLSKTLERPVLVCVCVCVHVCVCVYEFMRVHVCLRYLL